MNGSYTRAMERQWVVALLLMFFVTFLRLPTFGRPFENDSGATAYHARLIVNGEPLYGTHHPAHHMPGIYYTYALAFKLFGDSPSSVRFVLLLSTALAVFLVYRLGLLLMDHKSGLLAAALAAILFSHIGLSGLNAKIESFVLLPHIATVLLLLTLVQQKSASWRFLFVGLLVGVTFLFKVNYVSPLLLVGIIWLKRTGKQRNEGSLRWSELLTPFWLVAGFVLVVLPPAIYFAGLGLLDRALLVFSYGQTYITSEAARLVGMEFIVLYPLTALAVNNPILLLAILSGLLFLVRAAIVRRLGGEQNSYSEYMPLIALWFLLTIFESGLNRVYFAHYYLMMVTPGTLLAVWFIDKLSSDLGRSGHGKLLQEERPRAKLLIVALMLAIMLAPSVIQHSGYYYHFYSRYLPGSITYTEFMAAGFPNREAEYMARMDQLINYIQARTTADDTIYSWSDDMHIFYQANRRAPVATIWPLYANLTGAREGIFEATYIVVGPSSGGQAALPGWFRSGLGERYYLEAVLHDKELYRRAP